MSVKNRGWVKNAAIIFLAVLLALTFFSNTILNRSLPEVSGGYYYGGTIRSAIRGQGQVAANASYSVQLSETREIKSVLIKAGEHVEAGQLLFMLEESDSEELQTAIRALEDLNLALTKKLLQMRPADYGADDRAIDRLQEEIKELEEKRQPAIEHAQALLDVKQNVKAAEAILDVLLEEQAVIEENIAALAGGDEYDYERLLTDYVRRLRNELEAAKDAEKEAQKALAKAEEALAENGGSGGDYMSLLAQRNAKYVEVNTLQAELDLKRKTVLLAINTAYSSNLGTAPNEYLTYHAAKTALEPVQADITAAENALFSLSVEYDDPDILTEISEYLGIATQLSSARAELNMLEYDLMVAQNASNASDYYKDAVTAAKNKLEKATENLEAAQNAFDRAFRDLTAQYKTELTNKKAEVKAAQGVVTDVKEIQTELEAQSVMKVDEIDTSIKTKQREIEDLLFALADKQSDDSLNAKLAELDLQADRRAITDQEEQIEKLRGKAEASEVTSRYAGIITAVNCIAGDSVAAGTDLASLDIEGKGFSVNFSVTTEQAQKLRIGDSSTISRYWGEDLLVTLSAIRNDPESQGRQKILEFTVEGEVTVGEQLNVTIGERDQNYDCVLPNSAIREDADGKFILIAEVRNTPLGSRYTAVRLEVVVLAKDELNTAIAGDTYNNEFVITTATKPVEPGTQVRLVGG